MLTDVSQRQWLLRILLLISPIFMLAFWAQTAAAEIDRSMCKHTDDRMTLPDEFPMSVCFDGKTLHVANTDLDVVSQLRTTGDAKLTGPRERAGTAYSAGWIMTMIPGVAKNEELFPGTKLQVSVGAGESSVWLAPPADGFWHGLPRLSIYPGLKLLLDLVPVKNKGEDVRNFITLYTELMDVTDKARRCEKNASNVIGRARCDLVHMRDVTFALSRWGGSTGINHAKNIDPQKVLGWASAAVTTTMGATDQFFDYRKIESSGRIKFAPARRKERPQESGSPTNLGPRYPGQADTPQADSPSVSSPEASGPSSPPQAIPEQPAPPLSFTINGACTTQTGTLTSTSSGFTPGGRFTISAAYPNGSPYSALSRGAGGTVRGDGSVAWQWACAGDPAGTYTTTITDTATGRSTGPVAFTIAQAPAATPEPPLRTETPAAPTQPAQAPPRPVTVPEQQATNGADTFLDPHRAAGKGVKIPPNTWVEVSCKLYAPSIRSATPEGFWYRIASPPWNNNYYAVANTFWNGDVFGEPYTHHVDHAVPNC